MPRAIRKRRRERPAPRSLVGYVRVSTSEQGQSGLSLDAQRQRIRGYAEALGYRLVAIETDVASGTLRPDKRDGLTRAHGRVRSGEVAGLVVFKLDRLSRSTRDLLAMTEDARKGGWQLLSVSEQLDTSNATGQFVLTMLAALAQMERELISERTATAMRQLAVQGRVRSRFVPWGFRVDGKPRDLTVTRGEKRLLVKHSEEQQILRRVLGLYDEGNGAVRIAKRLNARGCENPRTGKPWNPSTLASLIRTAQRWHSTIEI